MVKGSRISWHLLLVLLCAGLMGCFVFWQYGATHRSDCLGDQLEKLIHLKDGGHLSDAEFQLAKAKLGLSTEALPDEPAASPAAVAAAPEVAVPSVAPVPVEEIEEEGATLLPRVPNHLQVQPAKWFYLPEDFRELPLLPKSIWDKSLDMDQLDFPLMQAILLRLLRNETIRIQVYGGSMTFGEGCCTSCLMRQRDCSWPTQVVARLRQTFPGATIALDHRARGGCDLECSLPEMVMTLSGSETAFDWLMLDFSQNGMGRKTTIEEIVRVCHFFLPKTLVMVIFNRDMVNKAGNYRDKNMYDNYRAVSQHYTLPFLNYEAAMQSFVAAGGNETLMWSSKSRHPKFSAHAYYADMVSYFCNKQLRKLEEVYTELDISDMTPTLRKPKDLQPDKDWMNPMQKQVNLATIDVCVFPLTQHVAREPSKDSPSESSTGHWKLYEDRHNKPGWICTTENGEAITFKVTFSEQPKLMVQFLRSYSNIGDAEILIDSPFRWKWKGNGNMGVRTNFTLKGGAIMGVCLMNEPGHMNALSHPFADEGHILSWLAIAADIYRKSTLPRQNIKLYMSLIHTAFKNEAQMAIPWYHRTFSLEERKTWLVAELHYYQAWNGDCDGSTKWGASSYQCGEARSKGIAAGCAYGAASSFRQQWGPETQIAVNEFSLATFSEIDFACKDREFLVYLLSVQLGAFQKEGFQT